MRAGVIAALPFTLIPGVLVAEVPIPDPPPAKWVGLIGEYVHGRQKFLIREENGRLQALSGWFFLATLTEQSEDSFTFPGGTFTCTRGTGGRATHVLAGDVRYDRFIIPGGDGGTFHIEPVQPLDQLRREALAAKPPAEAGEFRRPELVDLTTLDPTIKLDIRYATTNNFLRTPFYTSARAFLQRPAAEALLKAHHKLAAKGYGLLIHDAYRPWTVTKMFWDATPEASRIFVADPSKGSRHNRGCAVDLTLYDLTTGKPVEMTGGYDEFSDRSYPDYEGGTSRQRWHRDLLRHAMEAEGFTVYEAEWWHFDYRDWRKYPILNLPFEDVRP
jgi:D-alanyl-D-alanine dipeptidase